MKLINTGLAFRNAEKTFGLGSQQELAKLKLALPLFVKNLIQDEIILYVCNYGMLHVVEQGNLMFATSGERIGAQRNGHPANGENWKLEMTDSDDQSIYIKNTLTNEYLFTTEHNHHKSSGGGKIISLALTPGGSDEFKWTFEYLDTGFRIRNSRNSKYLYTLTSENNNFFISTHPSADRWNTYKC